MDDEKRLWISTFTDSVDTDNWWVLNKDGEMLGRFSLSRDKWIREIKNNKIYTIETNFESGEFEIVRYRFESIRWFYKQIIQSKDLLNLNEVENKSTSLAGPGEMKRIRGWFGEKKTIFYMWLLY